MFSYANKIVGPLLFLKLAHEQTPGTSFRDAVESSGIYMLSLCKM